MTTTVTIKDVNGTTMWEDIPIGLPQVWDVKSSSWSYEDGWYVGEDASLARSISPSGKEWNDFAVEAKLNVVSGDAGIILRYSSSGFYRGILYFDDKGLKVEKVKDGTVTELGSIIKNISRNTAYVLRFFCIGSYLMAFLDGKWCFTAYNREFKSGRVGLEVLVGKAKFDYVKVWKI